ncbi:MAG: aldo/keto reductase [Desulfomonilaceae bacterium]
MTIPKRILGKTGEEVTILGLGGEGILRTFDHDKDAYRLVNRAIDLGINYFESARAYSGSEYYYGISLPHRRNDIFLTSKSHARDKQGALAHLVETLKNMNTDHLDLWQVHDVRTIQDVDMIFGPGGAIEAFVWARQNGLTRFIGVTGHHDPEILKKCISIFDFDTALIPVNPAEPCHNSFMDAVLPDALNRNMGVIGMKVYFRGLAQKIPWFNSMDPFFRYSLSQPISTAVIGCDSIKHLENNVEIASKFTPMTDEEMRSLVEAVGPFARNLMYYKP